MSRIGRFPAAIWPRGLNVSGRSPDEGGKASVSEKTPASRPRPGPTRGNKGGRGGPPQGGKIGVETPGAAAVPATGLPGARPPGVDRRGNPPLHAAGHEGAAVREAESQRPAAVAS